MIEFIRNVVAILKERWMVLASDGTCGVCETKHGKGCLFYSAKTNECLCMDGYLSRHGDYPKKWGRFYTPVSYRSRAERRLAAQQEIERNKRHAALRKQAEDHRKRQSLDGTLGAEANSVP